MGQEPKYEKQDAASEEEKGRRFMQQCDAHLHRVQGDRGPLVALPVLMLRLKFETVLLQLPALFSLPEKESMKELKTSTLLIVMALSHASLSTLGL